MTSHSDAERWFSIKRKEWKRSQHSTETIFSHDFVGTYQDEVIKARFSEIGTNARRIFAVSSTITVDETPCRFR